ncbi:MAG: efflux RND transporter permease subunit, partial [Methylophilaceae bacterium]|nr:efflux RND transporter permease subunit [Methylophilaceae bacterium]
TIGIETIRSQSIPGLSVITIIFNEHTDIFRNRQVISERLASIVSVMPPGIIPKITPLTSAASSVLGIGITSKTKSLAEIRTIVDRLIIPHLLSIPGVADVNVFGGKVKQYQIEIQPEKLIQSNISIEQIITAASKSSGVRGAGFIENNNQRIIVNTEGQSKSLEDIGKTAVVNNKNQIIYLKDLAEIKEGSLPTISAASINGNEGIYLSVQGQLGSDTYKLTQLIEAAVKDIRPSLLEQDIKINPELFKPANFIDASIKGVRFDIFIGSLLVIIVLFLFLFNFRTAFISATAIPLSLLTAIIVLSYFNLGLNIMVLSGLAIALGEVVDDAIIDSENIFRRLNENVKLKNPQPITKVVYEASMEVRSSVVYATMIVVTVFLPLLSLNGVAGKLFGPLGIAYIFSILASLIVALTVTPALSYLLLGKLNFKSSESPIMAFIKNKYISLLYLIEKRSTVITLFTFTFILIGFSLIPLFKTQFIPPLHEGHFIMHMTSLPGTSEKESLRIGNEISKKIRDIPGVKSVAQWVGRSPMGADTFGTHYSEFEIELNHLDGPTQDKILDQIENLTQNNNYVGLNFAINTFLTERIEETISGYYSSVVINIIGTNLDAIDQDTQKISSTLASVKGVKNINIVSPAGTPQITIHFLSEKLSQWGIQKTDLLNVIRAAFEGLPVAQVYEGNAKVNISVILNKNFRDDITDIQKLPIMAADGRIVQLGQVAYIAQENGRSKILHQGGKRIQTITADIDERDINDFNSDLKNRLSALKLNQGNYYEVTGEAEANAKSQEELIVHSIIAGAGILLMLYIAFGNLRNLLLTLFNLPFALIGGVFAVAFNAGWISIGSLVGFVTLFGITLRNSIMLISHYQHLIEIEGFTWNLETCIKGASERLPSILMTAIVTALGLLPLALGSGEPGKEIEGPMATIIVGGLVTSTILNLLILPSIMLHFGKFVKKD